MATPTLKELFESIVRDLEQTTGVDGIFGKTVLRGFASVQAAKLKLFYLALSKVQKNIFADTADSEIDGGTLERFGRVKIERNPFPATQGIYDITVQGQPGFTVPSGATYRSIRNDVYVVDTPITLTTTTGTAQIRSILGGTQIALSVNDVVSLTAPLVGIENDATVSAEVTAPIDAEDIEVYRAKVLEAYVLEPQGGAASDYRIWASDAQGARRVYPYVGPQAGIINIFVESELPDGTADQALLDSVESVINFDPDTTKPLNERGRRPISAWTVNYLSITPLDIVVTIVGLDQTSPEIEAIIQQALIDYLLTIRPFVSGADDPNKVNDTLRTTGLISTVTNAITKGNFFEDITFTVDGNPETVFKFENGDIPILTNLNIV